jgi:AraC-like DNA-binding protein
MDFLSARSERIDSRPLPQAAPPIDHVEARILRSVENRDEFPSDLAGGRERGLAGPAEWLAVQDQLVRLTRTPVLSPRWWSPRTAFCGGVESQTDTSSLRLDETNRPELAGSPAFYLHLTLAGWGHFERAGEKSEILSPGRVFLAPVPSTHRYGLPPESPGWGFAWISSSHPYLSDRLAKQAAAAGHVFDLPPAGPLTASVLRLVRGAIRKDFRDQFEAELALFELVVAFERFLQESREGVSEGRRLLDQVRSLVLARLPKTLGVTSLAAEFGLSRSYFGQFFREKTGVIPSHFATEVRIQEAARMLLDSRAPLKTIATACGFADATHFCKVFRRFRHMSPQSFRRSCS